MKARERLLVAGSLLLFGLAGQCRALSPVLRPAAPPDLQEPHQWVVSRVCHSCTMLLVSYPPLP